MGVVTGTELITGQTPSGAQGTTLSNLTHTGEGPPAAPLPAVARLRSLSGRRRRHGGGDRRSPDPGNSGDTGSDTGTDKGGGTPSPDPSPSDGGKTSPDPGTSSSPDPSSSGSAGDGPTGSGGSPAGSGDQADPRTGSRPAGGPGPGAS
ncbi:hypothetical protein O1L68_10315 [Streptomyces lydicus]|nr:hypothetical protein [Streptomyces lydicus]